jgi:hypothetical protein
MPSTELISLMLLEMLQLLARTRQRQAFDVNTSVPWCAGIRLPKRPRRRGVDAVARAA